MKGKEEKSFELCVFILSLATYEISLHLDQKFIAQLESTRIMGGEIQIAYSFR